MATWITNRTQTDVNRVKELTNKARAGTWTTAEKYEWAVGMKGALSYMDYNRIENGMKELAEIVGASISSKSTTISVNIATAKNTSGEIPAWTKSPTKAEFYMPFTAKKAGLKLHSLQFSIKALVGGKLRIVFRKYGSTTALVDRSVDLSGGTSTITLSMGDFSLENGVEYQIYVAAANNCYSPSVESSWVISNDYIDISKGSAYYGDDSKLIFAGTVTIITDVASTWTVDDYLTASDASRWIGNVNAIRAKCSAKGSTPSTPSSISYQFSVINQVEKVLSDIETMAKDHILYCSDPICGGEPYYAVY